jgi:hypothetical protein
MNLGGRENGEEIVVLGTWGAGRERRGEVSEGWKGRDISGKIEGKGKLTTSLSR